MLALAVLTFDRPVDLARLLDAVRQQTVPIDVGVVVDAGSFPAAAEFTQDKIRYIRSEANLGGAGGFSLAILSALATGADWIWIMDDDACPVGTDCLARLLQAARERELDVVSPVIVSPDDHHRTSFAFRIGSKLTYRRADVEKLGFVPNFAHFFNGALVRRDVFFRIGLPDMKLFIRGDEVDFLLRLREAGVAFGTLTSAAVSHPAGWSEVVPIIENRVAVLIPETCFKRYYFFRNRGYLARRHRRIRSLLADAALYPYVFLVQQRGNVAGLREWARAFGHGLLYRFDRCPTGSVGAESIDSMGPTA